MAYKDTGASFQERGIETRSIEEGSILLPLGWFAEFGRPVALYRVMGELLDENQDMGLSIPSLEDLEVEILNNPEAQELNSSQAPDGWWGEALIPLRDFEGEGEVISTYSVYCRLLDMGWGEENACVRAASRVFFNILSNEYNVVEGDSERDDLDPERLSPNSNYKELLREAAAAALAQAGYDTDPRITGYAGKLIKRIDDFIRSVESNPDEQWVKIGSSHVFKPGAYPPSVYALQLIAHLPELHVQYRTELRRLHKYLSRTLLSGIAKGAPPLQLLGKDIIEQPHLITGNPLSVRYSMAGGMVERYELFWLEIFAKMGWLTQNVSWMKLYRSYLLSCDTVDGVWRNEFKETGSEYAPPGWIVDFLRSGSSSRRDLSDIDYVDVNLRIALIARYLGMELLID